MNIKRGFFRLWIAGSVVWVAVAGTMALPEALRQPLYEQADKDVMTFEEFTAPTPAQAHAARVFAAELMAGPPLAAGVVLVGIAWVIGGFRQPD
jgi:hypothetical protein